MRKMLVMLLVIIIMTPNFIFAAAGSGSSGGKDHALDITKVTTSQVITYAWDLNASFVADNHKTPSTAEFKVEAARSEKSDELTVHVEAEIDKSVTLDTVTAELGGIVDDSFQAVRIFEISDFEQESIDGITKLELDVTLDLLDLSEEEIALLQKVRLSVPISDSVLSAIDTTDSITVTESVYDGDKNKDSDTLTATHSFSLPDSPTVVDANAKIETNFLEVLDGLCTTDASVDDWNTTAEVGDDDELLTGIIKISFDKVQEVKDAVINVKLKGDGDKVLETIDLRMTLNQVEVPGDTNRNSGHWISPVGDKFVLSKRSIPVRFQLEATPAEAPVLYIYEADDSDDIPKGKPIAKLGQDQLAKGNGGKKAKGCAGSLPDSYYKYNLKTKNLSFLEEGGKYILAVMVDDELLYFENKPATLSFTVAENALISRWSTKLNIKSSDSSRIKHDSSNRASRRNK